MNVQTKKSIKEAFRPAKLKFARICAGLSLDGVVRAMDNNAVTKMCLSKYERGIITPTATTLQVLASILRVDVSYFLKPELTYGDIEFRTLKNATLRDKERYTSIIKRAIERRITDESYVHTLPDFTNPLAEISVSGPDTAEQAATLLRSAWEIGTQPIHSVYELLEEHGILVVETDIDCDKLDGAATFANGDIPVVVINTHGETTTERKRFTALHELAHLILRITDTASDTERLCHKFAGAMLITGSALRRRLGAQRTSLLLSELISIRTMYGISIAATIHRAHDLGIIPRQVYDKWFDEMIKSNRMEEGWGDYPVKEQADRTYLLHELINNIIRETNDRETNL